MSEDSGGHQRHTKGKWMSEHPALKYQMYWPNHQWQLWRITHSGSVIITVQNRVKFNTDMPHLSTRCLKKRPTFTTCYNFYVHSSIATIFRTNVAEKVGNQNVLDFPTSANSCFYTTWGNRKPGNCVFSLNAACFLTQKTRNTFKNISWSEPNHPSLSKRSSGSTRQDLGTRKGA